MTATEPAAPTAEAVEAAATRHRLTPIEKLDALERLRDFLTGTIKAIAEAEEHIREADRLIATAPTAVRTAGKAKGEAMRHVALNPVDTALARLTDATGKATDKVSAELVKLDAKIPAAREAAERYRAKHGERKPKADKAAGWFAVGNGERMTLDTLTAVRLKAALLGCGKAGALIGGDAIIAQTTLARIVPAFCCSDADTPTVTVQFHGRKSRIVFTLECSTGYVHFDTRAA